jgi:hypothetical protein
MRDDFLPDIISFSLQALGRVGQGWFDRLKTYREQSDKNDRSN